MFHYLPNPAGHLIGEPKLSYVLPVDDTWFVGSGVNGTMRWPPGQDHTMAGRILL